MKMKIEKSIFCAALHILKPATLNIQILDVVVLLASISSFFLN